MAAVWVLASTANLPPTAPVCAYPLATGRAERWERPVTLASQRRRGQADTYALPGLRMVRLRLGWTQEHIAWGSHICTSATLGNYERLVYKAPAEVAYALADYLGVELHELVTGEAH